MRETIFNWTFLLLLPLYASKQLNNTTSDSINTGTVTSSITDSPETTDGQQSEESLTSQARSSPGPLDMATQMFEDDGVGVKKFLSNHDRDKIDLHNHSMTVFTAEFLNKRRAQIAPEAQLYSDLMVNYNKNTRPVMNASHTVDVNLDFTFSMVLGMEEKEQTLTVILWMEHYWRDEKLIWDPDDYNGIREIKIPSANVWRPDIVLYNNAEKKIRLFPSATNARAFVNHTGSVYWSPIMKYICSCNIDITYFPFDDQICYLKLGSWAYDGFQVNVFNKRSNLDLTQYTKSSEFELVNSTVRRYITTYQCCIEPYPDVKIFLHIRRQTIQHVFNIVIPCVVLSIICMVGFLIPPNKNDEKTSVQMTVLFSLSLFMLLVAESTPRTSDAVPLLSVYLTALMSLTAMSTTAHVVCDKLIASTKIRNKIPYLVNKALFLLVKCCRRKYGSKREDKNSQDDEYIELTESLLTSSANGQSISDTSSAKKSLQTPLSQQNARRHTVAATILENNLSPPSSSEETTLKPAIKQEHEQGLEGLFHHLKVRQEKMRSELQKTSNWYQVAARLDKFFFWAYGISVTILTLYAFVFKPMQKNIQL